MNFSAFLLSFILAYAAITYDIYDVAVYKRLASEKNVPVCGTDPKTQVGSIARVLWKSLGLDETDCPFAEQWQPIVPSQFTESFYADEDWAGKFLFIEIMLSHGAYDFLTMEVTTGKVPKAQS